ncbi:MAG: FCD domain-containing protein [Arachnia sp.]
MSAEQARIGENGRVNGGGFESVLDHLTGEILAGRVAPGDRLPNERDLAAQLSASRSAVREAIKVLQAQGVVTSHTGPSGGTRVATGQGMAIGRMLKLHVALGAVSFDDLTETRVMLERDAARAAAGRIDEAALATLEHLLDGMSGSAEEGAFNELDTAFHITIAGIGANRLSRDIAVAIREAVAGHILEAERALEGWPQLRERLNAQHRSIVDALRQGDAALAADRIEDHIRDAHRALLG